MVVHSNVWNRQWHVCAWLLKQVAKQAVHDVSIICGIVCSNRSLLYNVEVNTTQSTECVDNAVCFLERYLMAELWDRLGSHAHAAVAYSTYIINQAHE
jgi:hypothetical protein